MDATKYRGYTITLHGRRWRWQARRDGQKVRRAFDSIEAAKAALDRFLDERGQGHHAAAIRLAGGITVGELVDRWLELHDGLSPRSRQDYDSYRRTHIARIADLDATALRPMDVQAFFGTMTKGRVPKVRAVLNQAMEWGIDNGLVAENPVARVKAPRYEPKAIQVPAPDEVELLLQAAAEVSLSWFGWVKVAAVTVARRGEVCALRAQDVDEEDLAIHIRHTVCTTRHVLKAPKTKAGRRVLRFDDGPASMDLFALLRRLAERSPNGHLFPNERSGGSSWLNPNTATHRLARMCKGLGLEVGHPHALRHGCAVELLNLGWPAPEVAAWLGHSRPSLVLDLYANHVRQDNRRRMGGGIAARVKGPEWH